MHITSLTLTNWGPYYGTHTVMLTDTVYAVQAAHEDDQDRSNWIGKSWFLGAIRFLLTGVKPETCPNEDGWISWGEKTGSVEGVLSDGTTIRRSRKIGASTQLELTLPGQGVAKQDHAQRELYALIGMDHEDLMATSFIEQRQIARLILADPSERTKIVNGWMELEPLQKAEAWLKERLLILLKEAQACIVPDIPEGVDRSALESQRDALDAELIVMHEDRDRLKIEFAGLSTWETHAQLAKSFPSVQERGKQVRAELDSIVLPDFMALVKAREEAALEKGEAKAKEEQLIEMIDDRWDGMCPKMCAECPVSDQVRNHAPFIQANLVGVEQWMDDADAKYRAAHDALQTANVMRARKEVLTKQIEQLRSEGKHILTSVEFIEEHGLPPSFIEMRDQIDVCTRAIRAKETERSTIGDSIRMLDELEVKRAKLSERRKQLDRDIALHREAVAIVGRQGAQKEIAEAVLADIEAGANVLLSSAGIDLTIEVSWSREGKGLATHCDTCGMAFPKSTTVKQCALCGVERGPKQVEKLSIQPNDRSGAADDIAGLAFQLAASFWLRAKRSAPWAVACIDEPFGQLDRANSRALSAHVHTLISGYAFEQGFIVAHDASIMEALPARVQIRGTEQGSSLEVM